MADQVVIACMRIEDTAYSPPGAETIRCQVCQAVCSISQASKQQWLADHPTWPHRIVCHCCLRHEIDQETEMIIPNAAVLDEIRTGLRVLLKESKEP